MICEICQQSTPDDSTYCLHCGAKIEKSPIRSSIETSKDQPIPVNPAWGIHLNCYGYMKQTPCPGWVNSSQREQWDERGVIVWDAPSHTVTRLRASQALSILEELRNTEEWKEHGIIVGEPVQRLMLPNPEKKSEVMEKEQEQKGEWVLTNQIPLSNLQTQELFAFFVGNEETLKDFAKIDKENEGRLLAQVYEYILSWKK